MTGVLAALRRDLGLIGASEVHDGVNNDVVVLEAVLGFFNFSLRKLAEFAVDFKGRVVELVIVRNSGPSVENGLEIVTDTFTISMDLISFSLIIYVLLLWDEKLSITFKQYLERESDDEEINNQSFAVGINVISEVTREFS